MDEEADSSSFDVVDVERARRIAVWEETHSIVTQSQQLDPTLCWASIAKYQHPPRELPSPPLPTLVESTSAPSLGRSVYHRVTIVQRDCIHVALELTALARSTPLLMDAGSRSHFGGGYENGARAQEEELCRRSNLAHCMDPQHGFAETLYPLEPTACIYVPSVQFFRDGGENDYAIQLHEDGRSVRSTALAVGIVAATRNPVLVSGKLRADIGESTQEALASFFHCARIHGHRSVVLVPLGCGAYNNPPGHIAQLFDAALLESLADGGKLADFFDDIVFSVLDFPMGQPARMTNNFCTFAHFFGSRGARVVDAAGKVVDYRDLQLKM